MRLTTWSLLLALIPIYLPSGGAWAAPPEANAADVPQTICAGSGTAGARILVGRTDADKVTVVFGDRGGTCDYEHVLHDGLAGLSVFGANFSSQTDAGEQEDIFGSSDCPGLIAQMARRRPSKERKITAFRGAPPGAVQAGPFTITDFGGYFDLQSKAGRHEAAAWISKSLAAARPCWEWHNDDPNPLLKRLYGDLGMKAPSPILSPEALARQVEDRELQIAISGRPPSQYQSPQNPIGGRPALDIVSVIVDHIEQNTDGPNSHLSLLIKIRNIGTESVEAIWEHTDLNPFLDFGGHALVQRKKNACDELGELRSNKNVLAETLLPGDSRILRIDEKALLDFNRIDGDEAYGGDDIDFLTLVGCLKYTPSGGNSSGALTFAYVIGKEVDSKFDRITWGDRSYMVESPRIVSLNRDYR